MTTDIIAYSDTEQQITKLKEQGLIIHNENRAKRMLEVYGYSNLIKSYREPYIVTSNNNKVYRSGITFDHIYSLYMLDKNLRNAVMASMIDLEEHIKAVAAEVIAQSFGTHQDSYLNFRNYRDKKRGKPQFSLSSILAKMRKTLDTDKNPIAHYSSQHGIVPPWILFKSVYFSTIVNFINLMKPAQQKMIVQQLYPSSVNIPENDLVPLMLDTLFICLEYRNMAAHGGRIYNYVCSSQLRFSTHIDESLHGFSQLLFLLHLLRYDAPYLHLQKVLNNVLSTHCNKYPEDITYLGQILNMNITAREVVYITKNSKKYHINRHCSGIQNAIEIELSQAKEQGFIPCKKCSSK